MFTFRATDGYGGWRGLGKTLAASVMSTSVSNPKFEWIFSRLHGV